MEHYIISEHLSQAAEKRFCDLIIGENFSILKYCYQKCRAKMSFPKYFASKWSFTSFIDWQIRHCYMNNFCQICQLWWLKNNNYCTCFWSVNFFYSFVFKFIFQTKNLSENYKNDFILRKIIYILCVRSSSIPNTDSFSLNIFVLYSLECAHEFRENSIILGNKNGGKNMINTCKNEFRYSNNLHFLQFRGNYWECLQQYGNDIKRTCNHKKEEQKIVFPFHCKNFSIQTHTKFLRRQFQHDVSLIRFAIFSICFSITFQADAKSVSLTMLLITLLMHRMSSSTMP